VEGFDCPRLVKRERVAGACVTFFEWGTPTLGRTTVRDSDGRQSHQWDRDSEQETLPQRRVLTARRLIERERVS